MMSASSAQPPACRQARIEELTRYCDFYDLRQLARLEIQMSSPPNDPVWRVDAK